MRSYILMISFQLALFDAFSQDIIYTKDNDSIECHVLKITENVIEFKKIDQSEGPIREISILKVHKIMYKDGTYDTFESWSKGRHIDTIDPTSSSNTTLKNEEKILSSLSSPSLSKKEILVQIADQRISPTFIGKTANGITWIPFKFNEKDKKNIILPTFSRFYQEEFRKLGFTGTPESSKYVLDVILKNVFFETTDNFTYIQVYQTCTTQFILKDKTSQGILFDKTITANHSGKANEIRKMKLKGYDLFYLSIKSTIDKLLSETDFMKMFPSNKI